MVKRGRLTLISLVLTVVTMLGLIPFVLSVVSLPLFLVWIGIPMFLGATLATRWWADAGRWLAGQISGRPVPRPYLPAPAGSGLIGLLRRWLTDPATWRDLLWLLVSCVAGFVLVVVQLTFAAAPLFYLLQPLLIAVTPPGVFTEPFGPQWVITEWWQGFALWPVALLCFGVWWLITPPFLAAWAGMARGLLGPTRASELAGRVSELTSSRAETRDAAAAELRRIERDLHDGAQVRLASVGINLGLAEQLLATDPERARTLLAEASAATTTTMADLRALVRGIHPPVLADRGLVGAVESLTLEVAVPCAFSAPGLVGRDGNPTRFDPPIESCLYFGVAECLANVVKHSGATHAAVSLARHDDRLVAVVTDNGHGGAAASAPDAGGGTGLAGVERRLRAFDGNLHIASPVGGPTSITLELPWTPLSPTPAHSGRSSRRTTRSSAKA